MFNDYRFLILIILYLITNFASFIIMSMDKLKARNGEQRISEGDLFFLSICFGALGVLLGMRFVRHKTKKIKFILGIPLALIQNLTFLILIFRFFMTNAN